MNSMSKTPFLPEKDPYPSVVSYTAATLDLVLVPELSSAGT